MALADALLKDESDTVRKAVSGKAQALPDRHLITVVILEGDGKGQRFQLKKSSNVVGRKMNCEVWLTDSEVSRKHCIIEVYGDTVILKDAGSINGTVFNNQVIKEVILKHEDRFQVGGTVLQLLITPKT
jgi:pSer/pThr/pTyr-binding forkhead associated (FHA) protein